MIYSGLAFYHLKLPGMHHDEAQEAALMGMQLKNGLPPVLFRDTGLTFAGRTWPLMVQDYIGALNVYLAWIAFSIGGVSVESLRTLSIFTGILTLVMAFGAAWSLAGKRAAALTVLLLAVHPTQVFWTRQGVYVTSYTQTLALAALWLMVRWWRGGKAWHLWLAAFMMGVGLWGKLLFIWFMGAVFVSWLLLNLPRWIRSFSLRPDVTTSWHSIGIAIVCGILGLTPLIAYNLKSGGTLDNIFGNFDQSYYGVDNRNVRENFTERVQQAQLVFESGHMWELGGQFPNPVARAWLFLAAGACLVAAALTPENRGVRLFMVLMVILMVAQSSFTSTALWYTHFALILPFMVMMGAVGLLALADGMSIVILSLQRLYNLKLKYGHEAEEGMDTALPCPCYRVFLKGLSVVLVMLIFSLDALSTWKYHHTLHETGGLGTHSDAIYRLVEKMQELPPHAPVAALDWGIGPVTETLTESRIVPNEVFGYGSLTEADAGFAARLAPFFALEDSLYILHTPPYTVFQRREAFFQSAREANRELVLLYTIPTRTGADYFEVWGSAK